MEHAHVHPHVCQRSELPCLGLVLGLGGDSVVQVPVGRTGKKRAELTGTKYATKRTETKALMQHEYAPENSSSSRPCQSGTRAAESDGSDTSTRRRKPAALTGSKYAALREETKSLFEGKYAGRDGDSGSSKRTRKAAPLTGTKYAMKRAETKALMEHDYNTAYNASRAAEPCFQESSLELPRGQRHCTEEASKGEATIYGHTPLWENVCP
jgi:hypothetical protein